MNEQTATSSATEYEPSASDPRIVAALAARSALNAAFLKHDVDAVDALAAPDLIVNAPLNAVVHRDNVLARFRSNQIAYSAENFSEDFEFVGVRGDAVIIMGEEIVEPIANAPHAGKVVHRRFTDVWKNIGGTWKLALRQATVTSIE